MNKIDHIKQMLVRKQGIALLKVPEGIFAELQKQGWTLLCKRVPGQQHLRYHGVPPKSFGG